MTDVAVIVPAYNADRFLDETLSSVLEQTFPATEVFVVDDGSTDRTRDIVRSWQERMPALRLIEQPNGGAARARNSGLAAATADLVAFLDADDVWLPEKLERQVALLNASPSVIAVGTLLRYLGPHGPLPGLLGESGPIRMDLVRGARLMPCALSSLVVRRTDALAVGGFGTVFSSQMPVEDLDFVARLARAGEIAVIPTELGQYRLHEGSLSHHSFAAMRRGARFVRARLDAEEQGRELSPSEFTQHDLSLNQRRSDLGMLLFRRTAMHLAMGRPMRAFAAGAAATLIAPIYVLKRAVAKFSRRR